MSDIRIKMAKDLRDMSDMVGDLHWMAAKAIEELVKKEGEIAKRDEELAACRVAVENCEVFRARIVELEARIVWLECEAQVNAAPVSEAKAQGVVIPPSPYMPGSQPTDFTDYELGEIHGRIAMWEEVKRLNAAPVQQVSVPDGKVCVPVEVLRLYEFMAASFTPFTSQHEQIAISLRKAKAAMLAAAPAAPAADAGLVEALKQAFPLFDEDGLNELYHHCEIAVLGDRKRLHKLLATHSAKGVV